MSNNLLLQGIFLAFRSAQGLVKIEITATAVAWYGAIVATASVFISLLSYLRNRSRVRVKVSEGFLAYPGRVNRAIQVFIEAVNIGRRPVTLTGVGFSLKNKRHLVIPNPGNIRFPHELKEGKSCQVWTDKKGLLENLKKGKTCITSVWYRDATGRIYRTRYKLNYGDR